VLRAVGDRYFEPVRFPPEAEAELRALHEKGFVIHVMRSTAWVNYLYLVWALVRRGLPPVRAVVNLRRWFTRPWRKTAQRGALDVRFTYARRNQGSGLVFLNRALLLRPSGQTMKEDPFPALVALARKSDKPVYLVPELFVWERWAKPLAPGIMDYLFGSPEAPGFLHTVIAFWRNHQQAQFRVGEPIDLQKFVQDNPEESDEVIARKVRGALHHHLARETRAVFGPPMKGADRVIYEIVRDREMQKAFEEQAEALKKPKEQVQREVEKNLDQIAARYHPTVVAMISPLLHWVFNRIYDGIEVDESGLERALKAGTRAPIVLCPSHKSHVDYLILSWVLWNRGYAVPHIAAGANLSFFPLGPILRRAGAFFLRRSFKGDALYSLAFKSYVRKLVKEGTHQEFFPEGGRSRSGKLLMPKLGLLTWEVDAVLEGASHDLCFLPVSIDYDRVVESKSLSRELSGGEKKPEDLKALLTTPKVLTARYGRIYLSFDEPVFLSDFAKLRGVELTENLPDEKKKNLVRALGNRIMFGISRKSTVTPQALVCAALLAHRRRGVTARELAHRITLLRQLAQDEKVPFSATLANAPSDPAVLGPIQSAIATFQEDEMVKVEEAKGQPIYLPVEERRVELSIYKNSLMNLVASRALVANAILGATPGETLTQIQSRALFLSRLFKFEFIYEVGLSFPTLFERASEKLSALGLVLKTEETLAVAPEAHARPELEFHADLLRDLLEAYWLAARTLNEMKGPVDTRTFVRDALELGRAELLSGRIRMAEARNRSTLENAIAFFKDQGYLTEENRQLQWGSRGVEVSERTELLSRLEDYVRPGNMG